MLTMRAVRETRVIEVQRGPMLTLMSRIPEMSDIIITVFSARRRGALDERDGSLQLIGEDEDRNAWVAAQPGSLRACVRGRKVCVRSSSRTLP